jgi:predicted O-methyltransferase YrrM
MLSEFAPPSTCVILVPANGAIERDCDAALRELERRGHPVWRVGGYAAVDAARNQMATDALAQGFEEMVWIDSDIVFDPNDVAKLRAHKLPIVCGLYPKKGPRQFACEFLPGTPGIRLGKRGGLIEIRYCGFGFAHVRKSVYASIHQRLNLPICNQRFGVPLVPFFEPMSISEGSGKWSLSEDYAFCERARQAGVKIMADTSIRLWHVGPYKYGWEDAGGGLERFAEYNFRLPNSPPGEPLPAVPSTSVIQPQHGEFTEDWLSHQLPVWENLLTPLAGKPLKALEIGVFEGRSTVWLLNHVLTHPESILIWIDTFGGSNEHAGKDLSGLEDRFRANTARFGKKVSGHVGRSQDVLRDLKGEFDLIYIDGSHEAADVLADAVLAWPLLKPGGLMGFDDYGWRVFPEPERRPAPAVDAFLTCMRGKFTEVHRGYQVWVKKPSGR